MTQGTAKNPSLTDTQLRASPVEVSADSLPLPSGAATAAKQPALGTAGSASTDVITVQGITSGTPIPVSDNSGSLTVDNGGTFPVQAAQSGTWNVGTVTTVTNVVHVDDNGSTLTVDGTVAATQSGTWNVGTLSTITNVVHIDDNSSTISIDDGGSTITVDGTVAVTNGGTFATQVDGAALTALQLIDDPVATLGTTTYTETSTKGMIVGAVRRDADTSLVDTTNEIGPLQMDANGRLKVEAFSGETLPVSLTSTTVTGTVAVTQSGTWDEVGINDSGNSITVDNGGTFAVQAAQSGTWDVGTVTTITNVVHVDDNSSTLSVDDGGGTITVDGTVAVTNGGTFVTQENGAALTSLQLIDDTVFAEDVAANAADKGIAVLAVRRDADTSLVDTTGDYANLQVNANGALKVEVFSGETLPVSLTSTTVTGTVAVTQSGTWDEVGINDSGNSITVDNGGTFVTQENGAALTSLQLLDDTVFAEDVGASAGDKGVAVLAVRRDANTTMVGADNDYANLQVNPIGQLKVVDSASPSISNYQVSVDTTSGGVAMAPGTPLPVTAVRKRIIIVNHGTTDVYIGSGTVTTSNGLLLIGIKGAALTLETTATIKGIVASGSQTVSCIEEYTS